MMKPMKKISRLFSALGIFAVMVMAVPAHAGWETLNFNRWFAQWICDDGTMPSASNNGPLNIPLTCADNSTAYFATDLTPLPWHLNDLNNQSVNDHENIILENPASYVETQSNYNGSGGAYASASYINPNTGAVVAYPTNDYSFTQNGSPVFGYFDGPTCTGGTAGWLWFGASVPFDIGWYQTSIPANMSEEIYYNDCNQVGNITFQYLGNNNEIYPTFTIQGMVYTNVTAPTIVTESWQGAGNDPSTATIVERDFYVKYVGKVRWEEWCTVANPNNYCDSTTQTTCPSGRLSYGDAPPAPNQNGSWTLVECADMTDIEPTPNWQSWTVETMIWPNTDCDYYGNAFPGWNPYTGVSWAAENTPACPNKPNQQSGS
jgi:hypothetical protein